jgi:zinc D-Ala-D-Ala dipeptidase
MIKILTTVLVLSIALMSCKRDKPSEPATTAEQKSNTESTKITKSSTPEPEIKELPNPDYKRDTLLDAGKIQPNRPNKPTSAFNQITKANSGIVLDIKYATHDNFTKKVIYDCPACYLRPEAAIALKKIHNELKEKLGYGIKVFDCFRPKPYQQRLWDIVPNPDYVTPPSKGSMHSRGLAVDLTIIDKNGKELAMGTPYDFFGKEAHTDYLGHNTEVNKNRALLTSIMEKYGFKGIRTEWWHFSYTAGYPLDEWVWDCE